MGKYLDLFLEQGNTFQVTLEIQKIQAKNMFYQGETIKVNSVQIVFKFLIFFVIKVLLFTIMIKLVAVLAMANIY